MASHSALSAQHSALPRGCFIVGTDTGVGKTVLTATLARWMRQHGIDIGAMKPIETGVSPDGFRVSDAERLQEAAGIKESLETLSPYRFPHPVAPLAAARSSGVRIDPARIVHTFHALANRYEFMLVEGIGGVRVPVTETQEIRDLIKALDLPAIVVGRLAIGGINHAMLTVEALQQRQIQIVGIVLNDSLLPGPSSAETEQHTSTLELLRELSGVRVLGPLAYEAGLRGTWSDGVETLTRDPAIAALADLLLGKPRPEGPDRRPDVR